MSDARTAFVFPNLGDRFTDVITCRSNNYDFKVSRTMCENLYQPKSKLANLFSLRLQHITHFHVYLCTVSVLAIVHVINVPQLHGLRVRTHLPDSRSYICRLQSCSYPFVHPLIMLHHRRPSRSQTPKLQTSLPCCSCCARTTDLRVHDIVRQH